MKEWIEAIGPILEKLTYLRGEIRQLGPGSEKAIKKLEECGDELMIFYDQKVVEFGGK